MVRNSWRVSLLINSYPQLALMNRAVITWAAILRSADHSVASDLRTTVRGIVCAESCWFIGRPEGSVEPTLGLTHFRHFTKRSCQWGWECRAGN